MILLHNLKGGISGQIFKELLREDVKMLASNINKAEGCEWQSIIKFRRTDTISAPAYGYALCIHDAFEKDPYFIELSEAEAKGKLRAWGVATSEIEKLIQMEVE